MTTAIDALAEGLFASTFDPSDHLSPHDAKVAAFKTIRRLGRRGCACCVAAEYGDHPETAAQRMVWARDLVSAR